MKSLAALAAVFGLLAFGTGAAQAATCNIAGTSYTCEATCNGICNIETALGHSGCDSVFGNGNGDGLCMICGSGNADTITGTIGRDVICGKGGNDVINGDPASSPVGADDIISGDAGNDSLQGRLGNDTMYGGTGNDTLNGNAGDDTMYGEEDDDVLNGGDGDDELDGGDDTDFVNGDAGSDVLRGGDGDDALLDTMGLFQPGQLGGILCGGAGDDLLEILGVGSFCFDAGAGQTGTTWGESHDCEYLGPPSGATTADFATQRNCIAPAGPPAASAFNASKRSCNCQD